jgi:ferredoxin
MTAPSGYSVAVDMEKCNACGKCVKACHYSAMKVVEIDGKKKLGYSEELCMGCGVCASRCPNESISLVVNPNKGAIFDIDAMAALSRKAISIGRL